MMTMLSVFNNKVLKLYKDDHRENRYFLEQVE